MVRRETLALLAFGLSLAAAAEPLRSEVSELWAGLDPGLHGVGFRAVFLTDATRPYADSLTSDSSPFKGPGRPQRLSIWYPTTPGCEPMKLGEYLTIPASEPKYERWNRSLNERASHLMRVTYGTGKELFEKLSATRTGACLDPEAATGQWPWIVYSPGSNSHPAENLVLLEYLASHGFIVASIPHFASRWPGTGLGRVTDPLSTDTQLRDLAFAVAWLRDNLPVDPEGLALMGFSGGGLYALLVSGKYQGLAKAVVTLDGSGSYSHAPDFVEDPLYFGDRAAPLSLLDVHKKSDRLDLARFELLTGARRAHIRFDDAYHLDFTSLPLLHRLGPDQQDYYSTEELAYAVHLQETLAPIVRQFLAAELAANPTAKEAMTTLCESGASGIDEVRCVEPERQPSADQVVLGILQRGATRYFENEPAKESRLRQALEPSDLLGRAKGFSTFYLLDEALAVLEAAHRLWPEEPGVLIDTARVHRKMKDPCQAEQAFQQAQSLLTAAGSTKEAAEVATEREALATEVCE